MTAKVILVRYFCDRPQLVSAVSVLRPDNNESPSSEPFVNRQLQKKQIVRTRSIYLPDFSTALIIIECSHVKFFGLLLGLKLCISL
jgi:hypothetical protein